jgi:hypothetical protein
MDDVPQTFNDIKGRNDGKQWMDAVKEEMNALMEAKTPVKLPLGKKEIDTRWVFRIKHGDKGAVDRYKARLVVKGFVQEKGLDFHETYAPVARIMTVRVLLSVINHCNLLADQLDVSNAFFLFFFKEEIYIKAPQGSHHNSDVSCRLNKSLYRLKQAPRQWNRKFDEYVKCIDFVQSRYDKCLYVLQKDGKTVYLLLYVDDIIFVSDSDVEMANVKKLLRSLFKTRDLETLKFFLGIKIDRTVKGMFLSQSLYVKKLLEKSEMTDCYPSKIPIETDPNPELCGEIITNKKPYWELVGCLMYLMLTTRPDLSVAVNFYSRFQVVASETQ